MISAAQGLLGLWTGEILEKKMKPRKDVYNRFASPKPIQPHDCDRFMVIIRQTKKEGS